MGLGFRLDFMKRKEKGRGYEITSMAQSRDFGEALLLEMISHFHREVLPTETFKGLYSAVKKELSYSAICDFNMLTSLRSLY